MLLLVHREEKNTLIESSGEEIWHIYGGNGGRYTCDFKPINILGVSQISLSRVYVKYLLKSRIRIECSQGEWGKSSAELRAVSWFHRTGDSIVLTLGSWMLGKN